MTNHGLSDIMMSAAFLSARDVGQRLGVSTNTVLRWIRSGQLPCYRRGRKFLRIAWDDVVVSLRRESSIDAASTANNAERPDVHEEGGR